MRVETLLTGGLVVLGVVAVALAVTPRSRAATGRLWFATLARLVLAGYLGVAGLLKLPHPAESVRAVRAYRILPESIVPTIGYVLPLLEVAIALLLLLGLGTRVAAVLSSLLMTAFIIGIASVASRGISIDCGCFGGGGDVAEGATHYTQEIIRDVCLLLLGLLLVYRPWSRLSLDPSASDDLDLDEDEAPDATDRQADATGSTPTPAFDGDHRTTSTQEKQS
ncbi:MAG TPA: MauE/DoxX family redox-associated membrane protein [Actinomycetales bacterium]|nr:MauE/DoxX family redox-associated membrane protein [Actinomycetales bacterium]